MASRRAGAGEWVLRVVVLVLAGAAVWYGFTNMPFGHAGEERPLLYRHDGYAGRPDQPLDADQVRQLQERARTQGY